MSRNPDETREEAVRRIAATMPDEFPTSYAEYLADKEEEQ